MHCMLMRLWLSEALIKVKRVKKYTATVYIKLGINSVVLVP